MPKRSAEEKLAHYEKKIKKLKRRQRLFISTDEENVEETDNFAPFTEVDEYALDSQLTELDEIPPMSSESPIEVQISQPDVNADTPASEGMKEQELILDPELLSALGTCSSDTPDFGEDIHSNLAALWPPLLRKGLAKDDKSKLMKENLIPANCKLLQAPTLNPEITAAISEVVRGRDKKLTGFEQVLGQGISAINRAMDTLLKSDDKTKALKCLSDGCRLLADLHHSFTKDRIKLIIPSLEKNFLHIIQDTERDDTLFGNSLGEKIKACKAIEKQGQQIRKFRNHQSKQNAAPQTSTNRPVLQGNWTGPPRYPSIRGGRGGPQRPAPRAATRRPYHTTTPQTQLKNFNQKNRANAPN